MNLLSDQLSVEFDASQDALLIWHPDRNAFPSPLITVRAECLRGLSFDEAAGFIGERIVLLMPALREIFKDYFWDGDTPPKRT